MNSIIISSMAAFLRKTASAYKKSALYRMLMRIYNAISASWNNSAVMNRLRRNGTGSENSIIGRVLGCPFTFLSYLRRKIGQVISKSISQSFICTWSKVYIQNFMAVNTRFFGMVLLFAGIGYEAVYLRNMHVSKIAVIAMAVGAVMTIVNYNLMSFLNPSKLVSIIKSAAGFKNLEFDFFDERQTKGKLRLVLAAAVGFVAGFAMHYSTLYGAAVPFALFGALLVMYAPITGVYAAVFFAPVVPTMVLAGICIWTLLSLIIKSISDMSFKWKKEGVGLCMLTMLAVLLVSSIFSFSRFGSLKVWMMYFVFMMFYFAVINTVKSKEQLYGLFKVFVISGALVALYGIMQYAFGWTTSNAWIDEEMFEDSTMRVYSTLGNPNVLGEYLLLVLPFAAVYMLKMKWRELSKWAYGAMFLVLALCLVLTQSRGCWIGFLVSVMIFVTFYEGKWWGLLPLALCILPFILPQTIVDRILSVGNMEDSSTSYRVYIWMGTLGMLKHYFLGGIGMGEAAFSQVYPFFSYNAITAPHSHNLFLQLLVEAGISGLIVFVIMQVVFIKKMSQIYRQNDKKSTSSMLALAAASGVMGFLVQSMFDYTFYNYRVMAVFFMVMALGIALKYMGERRGVKSK